MYNYMSEVPVEREAVKSHLSFSNTIQSQFFENVDRNCIKMFISQTWELFFSFKIYLYTIKKHLVVGKINQLVRHNEIH